MNVELLILYLIIVGFGFSLGFCFRYLHKLEMQVHILEERLRKMAITYNFDKKLKEHFTEKTKDIIEESQFH